MDPITTAILAALAVGVVGGATEVGKKAIVDAYDALKSIIKKKFGSDSKIVKAVTDLEGEPEFEPYKMGLQQRVKSEKIDQDKDILEAAQALLHAVSSQPDGRQTIQNIQNVYGDYNAVAGAGGQATVNVNQPRRSKE
jgi:hypothetical protein